MKVYRVSPVTRGSSWKIYGWKIEKEGWLGASVIGKFAERQDAVEFAKRIGDANRPSQIKIFDNKGGEVYEWSYGERPRMRR